MSDLLLALSITKECNILFIKFVYFFVRSIESILIVKNVGAEISKKISISIPYWKGSLGIFLFEILFNFWSPEVRKFYVANYVEDVLIIFYYKNCIQLSIVPGNCRNISQIFFSTYFHRVTLLELTGNCAIYLPYAHFL